MPKKETQEPVVKSHVIEKVSPKTKNRIEQAEKTITFIRSTLKVPEEDISKVLSRAFTIIKKK